MTKVPETSSIKATAPTSSEQAQAERTELAFVGNRAKTFDFQSREKFEWLCSATEFIDTARRDFRENTRRS